jgi:hypothetical protein
VVAQSLGLPTQRYRIYLRDRVGGIVGRADYESEDDLSAVAIGAALFEICSDVAGQYELWRDDCLVSASDKNYIIDLLAGLPHSFQQTVLDTAIAMRDDGWSIAESKQMIEKLKMLGHDNQLP